TYSSRLPLPLVSRMNAVQPCDFCSSPVSSNILVLNQPRIPPAEPPLLSHNVLLASSAKTKWCVLKQVSISVNFFVFGSWTARWRPALSTGKSCADGWLDPFLQKAGLAAGRMRDVSQTRPFSSNIGL